jgi:hypothetical protein
MHNLLGLFAKCLINLEKQKHLAYLGEILQCCRSAPYILLATLLKPLAFDSKLNVK